MPDGIASVIPMTMEILAYHGWGFTASCWEPYTRAFVNNPGLNVTWKSFDRGYFGSSQDIAFSTAPVRSGRVVIAHSYGLYFCPLSVLAKTELLILFNGFLSFHGSEPRLQQKSQRKLSRMIQAFAQDPLQTWANFMVQTFAPEPLPDRYTLGQDLEGQDLEGQDPEGQDLEGQDLEGQDLEGQDLEFSSDRLDESRLGSDLEVLHRFSPNTGWIDRLAQVPQIVLITSSQDRIVTAPLRPEHLPRSCVEEIVLSGGGHGAPFTQTDFCMSKISDAIGLAFPQKPYNARDSALLI